MCNFAPAGTLQVAVYDSFAILRPAHSVDMVAACHCGYSERFLAVAGLQSRSSLRWDRVDTHPDQASLCLPCSNVGAQTIRYDTGSSKAIIKPGKDAIVTILILIFPRFLNYLIALYLIVIGLIGLGALRSIGGP
jgi:Protein of unknown function (DUF3096)